MSILIGILIFGVIVLVHEVGHFVSARKCGILVEEFAIGMGPKLFGIQRGDTLFSIRMLPIGGFCKMLGEDEDNNDPRALNRKPVWQRIVVMASGAAVNLVFAFIIFFVLTLLATSVRSLTVEQVLPDYPAEAAGIVPGDRIVAVDGRRLNIYEDLTFAFMNYDGKPLKFTVMRDGRKFDTSFALRKADSGGYLMGIVTQRKTGLFSAKHEGVERATLLDSVVTGFWQIGFYVKLSIYSVVQLVTFNLSVDEMSGPIGIVTVIGQVYDEAIKNSVWITIATMLELAGMLSATLGVFNLLPVPALDGGRILFLVFEGVRGKPIEPEREGMIHFVGFVLLMAFAAFVAYNDIMKLINPLK